MSVARPRFSDWIPTSFWIASAVQTFYMVALAASDGYDVARSGEVIRVFLTYIMLLAVFGLVHLLGRSVRWRTGLSAALFVCFVAVNFARFETAGSFDYGFAHENFRELLTPLGRHIVLANVRGWEVGVLLLMPIALVGVIVRWPTTAWPGSPSSRRVAVMGCLTIVLGVPALRVTTHESLTGFAASAFRFHAEARAAAATIQGLPYPLLHDTTPSVRARELAGEVAPRPHLILLFLESWSGLYTDKVTPDGRHITPVFDARRREGLTFDHFYGNSVQSSRGHFATLCSLIPMARAKEFVDLPGTRLHCLPQLLRENGYRTSFDSATDEPEFDLAEQWLGRNGFDEVRFAAPRATRPDPALWGVGVQDDVFYARFFAHLDEKIAREPGRPQLAVLANASHHYPFDKGPRHLAEPGYATKYGRNYVGSLMASDAWLATFYAEIERRPALRDAIVVVVGDHSFPADEHGIHFNGLGSFEEAFRTSFSLRWPGHVPAEHVSDRAASQVDIAPTLLDLLQIRAVTHFAGRSLFAEGTAVPVPLVQPYDGVHLAAVRWPLKLVRHESAAQEHLYDLSQDPEEEHDRIRDKSLSVEVAQLRETFVKITASEAILRANRVWPDDP